MIWFPFLKSTFSFCIFTMMCDSLYIRAECVWISVCMYVHLFIFFFHFGNFLKSLVAFNSRITCQTRTLHTVWSFFTYNVSGGEFLLLPPGRTLRVLFPFFHLSDWMFLYPNSFFQSLQLFHLSLCLLLTCWLLICNMSIS